MLGTYALSSGYYDAYYRQAQKVRTLIAEEFDRAFESVDALVCPTSPIVAFPKGDKSDPLSMYLCDVLTIPVNLAGLPGISIPCGLSQGCRSGCRSSDRGSAMRRCSGSRTPTRRRPPGTRRCAGRRHGDGDPS